METETLHAILNRVQTRDYIEIIRRNQSEDPLTSRVEGYAVVDPFSKAVYLDLLDGAPHGVRESNGEIYSRVSEIWVHTHRDAEDSILFWTED